MLVTNFVWLLPVVSNNTAAVAVLDDWQLSGTFTAGSGAPYTASYSTPGVTARNLTGAQGLDSARIVIAGDPGSGSSSDPYKHFNSGKTTFEVRVDAFNALNSIIITNRNAVLNVARLTNPITRNLATDENGNLVAANIRGFGAVTGVAAPRTMQLTARFSVLTCS
jgi:hypothetical protein